MTFSHPRYIPYHQQPHAGCDICGEPFECNHWPVQEETMDDEYYPQPTPEQMRRIVEQNRRSLGLPPQEPSAVTQWPQTGEGSWRTGPWTAERREIILNELGELRDVLQERKDACGYPSDPADWEPVDTVLGLAIGLIRYTACDGVEDLT